MIQLEHIKKTYGESVIFRDFSLEIQDGEWIELCGNSGVGKTTLLQMMMGFVCRSGENSWRAKENECRLSRKSPL